MKKYILFYCIIILCSCNNKEKKQTPNLSFTIDTITINTQENPLSISNAPYIQDNNNIEYYINYDVVFKRLLWFNLKKLDFEKKIQFKKSGPGKLNSCEEYTFKGDTLIATTSFGLNLYTEKGEFIKSLKLKDFCPEIANEYRLAKSGITIANLNKIELDNKYNSVILRTFRNGQPFEDGFYDKPLLCELNINTEKGTPIPISYPDELYGKYFYGDLAIPNIITKGDSIIYHFHFKSSFYIYNRKTKLIKEIKFNAQHIPKLIQGGKKSISTFLFFGPKYHNLKYDKNKNIYYLLYSDGAKEKEKNYLIVFDKNLKKLGEVNIPSEFNSEFVISKRGLLFRNMEDLAYYHFNLYAVNIDLPNTNF